MTGQSYGRPPFIPQQVFRVFVKPREMDKYFRVDNILPTSFIGRCARQGKPIKSAEDRWGSKLYRPIDVVARAWAFGHDVGEDPRKEAQKELHHALRNADTLCSLFRNSATHDLTIVAASNLITGEGLVTEEKIVECAMRDESRHAGVYFLVKDREVIYVGQSVNVHARVGSHSDFDSWAFLPCPSDRLDVLESLYIHWLRPQRNGRRPHGVMMAPLSIDSIARLVVQQTTWPPCPKCCEPVAWSA